MMLMFTKQTRRKFLHKGLLAITGGSLSAPLLAESVTRSKLNIKEQDIIYRTLGGTGIKIPIISMGTGSTYNPALVNVAMDNGVKLFATSEYYQNGNNEKMLGGVFKNKPRESFYVCTAAIGGVEIDHKNGLFKPETNPEVYLEHANGCLRRLQVDYVDFFSLGYAARRESVFFEPLLNALQKFKAQGKTRYLSIGTHSYEPEAVRAAADTGVFDVVIVAYNFKKTNRAEINAAIEYARGKGLGIIAMKTMAGAYWDKERTKPINAKAALKWVLQNKNVDTAIPDCTSFDQLFQNLNLMKDLALTKQEKQDLKLQSRRGSSQIYCQQCGDCISQCPEGMDIPTTMRSYMYAYGYKNLAHAQQTLKWACLPENPCSGCKECHVNCTMDFNIKEKIADISRLRDVPDDFLLNQLS